MRTILATTLLLFVGSQAAADDRVPPAERDARTLDEVFFAFDSARLGERAAAKLAAVVDEVNAAEAATVVLGGHADPRGTAAYNVGLSARRAEAVRDALIRLGATPEQIVLGIYGEAGADRASHARERRVAIRVTRDPLHAIIDRALPTATALIWREPVSVAAIEGRATPVATR